MTNGGHGWLVGWLVWGFSEKGALHLGLFLLPAPGQGQKKAKSNRAFLAHLMSTLIAIYGWEEN